MGNAGVRTVLVSVVVVMIFGTSDNYSYEHWTSYKSNVVSCEISTGHIKNGVVPSMWVIQYQCQIMQALAFPVKVAGLCQVAIIMLALNWVVSV